MTPPPLCDPSLLATCPCPCARRFVANRAGHIYFERSCQERARSLAAKKRGGPCLRCGGPVPDGSRSPAFHDACYTASLRAARTTRREVASERVGPSAAHADRSIPATRIATDDPTYVARVGWTGPELETRRATLERVAREVDAAERAGTLNAVPAAWGVMAYGAAS